MRLIASFGVIRWGHAPASHIKLPIWEFQRGSVILLTPNASSGDQMVIVDYAFNRALPFPPVGRAWPSRAALRDVSWLGSVESSSRVWARHLRVKNDTRALRFAGWACIRALRLHRTAHPIQLAGAIAISRPNLNSPALPGWSHDRQARGLRFLRSTANHAHDHQSLMKTVLAARRAGRKAKKRLGH